MKFKIKCYQGCGKEIEIEVFEEGYITSDNGVPMVNVFTDGTRTIDIYCTDCAEN
jgi:hypothetical protein